MKNKKWVKPELVILVRGDSGESVLAACKTGFAVATSPGSSATYNSDCQEIPTCTDCSGLAAT